MFLVKVTTLFNQSMNFLEEATDYDQKRRYKGGKVSVSKFKTKLTFKMTKASWLYYTIRILKSGDDPIVLSRSLVTFSYSGPEQGHWMNFGVLF